MFLYIPFIINLDFFEQTYLYEEKLHLKCALSNQTILFIQNRTNNLIFIINHVKLSIKTNALLRAAHLHLNCNFN